MAVYGDKIVYPDAGGLTPEERNYIKKVLRAVFYNGTVHVIELDAGGQGGANCLTGSVPVEVFAILKAQLSLINQNHFSG